MADSDDDEDGESESQDASGSSQAELLASYLTFAKRAFATRRHVAVIAFVIGAILTVLASIYAPKTYTSTSILMAQTNAVLEGRDYNQGALSGAYDLVMRHENLEAIVRDRRLIQKTQQRRPPLLAFKDKVSKALFGDVPEKIKMAGLVGTLEAKLSVVAEKGDLTIKADWSDAQTAFELVEAARESFLRARHTAEMSAFEEKMAIMEGHAVRVRDEVATLVRQLKAGREESVNKATEQARNASKLPGAAGKVLPDVPLLAPRSAPVASDLPELQQRYTALKSKLAEAEGDRERRVREEQAKLADLKLRFTSSHPQVITQEERIAVAAQVSSQLALLRAEVKDLGAELDQREGIARQAGGSVVGRLGTRGSTTDAIAAEPLPADVMQFLNRDDSDPALSTQLQSAVMRFGRYRDEVASARVQLDLAEAAFTRRYQIIVPAEAPSKPSKPKPGLILGAGLFLSLMIALILPIIGELRRGVMSDRWQVHQLRLPLLAEVKLPPYAGD